MLEHLFTSKARVRLLGLLMFNRDRQFHLREIAKLAGVSPIYASKELENLRSLGLVKKSKRANLSLYSVNSECVMLEDLRRLFLKTDYLGELIRKELVGRADYACIYGSFAKGVESEHSDIDLFVVSEINQEELLGIIGRLESETSREINYILWDRKTYAERKSNHLMKDIKANPVIMLIGDEDEFRSK